MIQRNSDFNKSNIFGENKNSEEYSPEFKKNVKKSNSEWRDIKNQLPKKLGEYKSGNDHTVISAQADSLKDNLGSNKQLQSETSYSIFGNSNIEKIANKISSKEKTLKEKNKIKLNREKKQKEWKESSAVKENVLTNNNLGLHETESNSRVGMPKASLSIFDSNKLSNLEPTDGEKMTKRTKQTDDSWKKAKKAVNSKDLFNNLFDKIISGNK